MNSLNAAWSPAKLVFNHLYVGVIITLFYVFLSPFVISWGVPSLAILLAAEVFILVPLVSTHLLSKAKSMNGNFSLNGVILFQQKLPLKTFMLWSVGGILASALVYVPLYPVGIYLRETLFAWLPEWYFNPAYGTDNVNLVAHVFLVGILVDGLLGPIAEELFFRGYLLPRMAYLKHWAPVVNGTLFGLYHFWQPHNLLALMVLGIIFSYVVWKKNNVYLGIAIHCTLNVLGAISGYLATLDGTLISR